MRGLIKALGILSLLLSVFPLWSALWVSLPSGRMDVVRFDEFAFIIAVVYGLYVLLVYLPNNKEPFEKPVGRGLVF